MLASRALLTVCILLGLMRGSTGADRPNVVFIMADELAYYELSHMGNSKLRTPHIDQFAREGLRFTQALAGAPVCAPLRCTLMTGKHMGHASVRANDGGTPLRAEEPTIASVLKEAGYATGGFGKWGAGGRGSTGVPEKHGFDTFFGYYDQVHAHSFYPPYLVHNSREVKLDGNRGGRSGDTYSHYEIMNEAYDFIREHQDEPFFCYLPITPPHGMYDIPTSDPAWKLYENDDWMKDPEVSQEAKSDAAMVSMVDQNLATVLELLRELELEDNTIVFFTGDNGGQDRFKSPQHPRGYFAPNVDPKTGVEFRGQKGSLFEGGLRIPFLVRWPGKISEGQVSDLMFSQVDVFPTLAELCDVAVPADLDGKAILPEILGEAQTGRRQTPHEYLYWEYGGQRAVRLGNMKGYKPNENSPWQIYDLNSDVSESQDLAASRQDLVKEIAAIAEREHEPVKPGQFTDRNAHERDRQAKWGSTRAPQPKRNKVSHLSHPQLLPSTKLSIASCSSESRGNGKLAAAILDRRPQTHWHSEFSPELKKHPHEVVIDLGSELGVSGIQYLARQDGGWNGAFAAVEVSVASNIQDLDSTESFKHTFEKKRQPQTMVFNAPRVGRYVQIRILSEVNGGPWASAAEIGVLGTK